MQIYGLPTGQVADFPGTISRAESDNRAAEAHQLQKDALSEQKRVENTQWIAGAAKYWLDNWGQPGIGEGLMSEAKQRGIDFGKFDPTVASKGGVMKFYQQAKTALGGPEYEDVDTLPAGQRDRFGKVTGIGGASAAKPPASISEYNLYSEQEIAAGKEPMNFYEFRKEIAKQESEGRALGTGSVIPAANRVSVYQKYPRMQAGRRDLEGIRTANEQILQNERFKGGPLQGGALELTEAGQSFKRYVDSLMSHVAALTRIPGVGAQSDWEGRLQQAPLPSLNQHPEVRMQAIVSLESLVDDLEQAVIKVSSGETANLVPQTNPASTDMDDKVLQQAREAIAAGKSRQAVMQRLQELGVDPSRL